LAKKKKKKPRGGGEGGGRAKRIVSATKKGRGGFRLKKGLSEGVKYERRLVRSIFLRKKEGKSASPGIIRKKEKKMSHELLREKIHFRQEGEKKNGVPPAWHWGEGGKNKKKTLPVPAGKITLWF